MARPEPSLITGTSSEYLGLRPLRRLLRERRIVFVCGPRGSGKSAVALRIASTDPRVEPLVLDTRQLQDQVVRCTRGGCWSSKVLEAPALVLDGPVFLQARPGVAQMLRDLLLARAAAGRRTVVCEVQQDRSVLRLMEGMPRGSVVTVGLRFPASSAGRMRFARRACDLLGLPRSEARGTDLLEPWGYERVLDHLRERVEPRPAPHPVPLSQPDAQRPIEVAPLAAEPLSRAAPQPC